MALSEHDKSEARGLIELALELNEPEAMIEGLRRLCAKRLETASMSVSERERWQAAHNALVRVAGELEASNRPQARANDAESAQAAP